jgi:hypothetical protein
VKGENRGWNATRVRREVSKRVSFGKEVFIADCSMS